ncbi:transforming growth factor beta regulator 1 [Achroia grisella]|uniref:transforming growth factor beta regulator 1 n=1 Tax=Achroia grisella TaxID=688607 RepID=UPI0027D299B4|nr:transforming growth factor beta regulator 1 [Achroia grisella]
MNINLNQNTKQSKRYKNKLKYLKLRVKGLLLENAALCDEVAKIQETILIVKDERKYLLRKLLEYENETEFQTYHHEPVVALNGSRGKVKKRRSIEDAGKTVSAS